MQVHGPSQLIGAGDLSVDLNPGGPSTGPFAMLSIGLVDVFLASPEEADALIRVAAMAKRLLSPEPEPAPLTVADALHQPCPEDHPETGSPCTGTVTHPMPHRDEDGREWATERNVAA